MKVKVDKCEVISFTRSRRQADGHHLTIDGSPVPWKTTVRYLGVLLNRTMTLTPHVDRICDLASKGLASLGPLLTTKRLSTRLKLRLRFFCQFHWFCKKFRRKHLRIKNNCIQFFSQEAF
jgi:hypothetical protein